jgi:hypothetical protein
MEAYDFSGPYPPFHGEQIRSDEKPEISDLLMPARKWANTFGTILHDYLSDEALCKPALSMLSEYEFWGATRLPYIAHEVMPLRDNKNLAAANELNFNTLNAGMIDMWKPIFRGGWEKGEQAAAIKKSQDIVAMDGLELYSQREHYTKTKLSEYFSFKNLDRRIRFEGMVNEFDTAIVLMDIIKDRPTMTVVPAPAQFEHGAKTTNADFIVVDTDPDNRRAIGVQVKMAIRAEDQARYDKSRIVLVDARIDLGNHLPKRLERLSSTQTNVAWAGLICASHIQHAKTYGKNIHTAVNMNVQNRKHIIRIRGQANQMLQNIRPNVHEASRVVGKRVLDSL